MTQYVISRPICCHSNKQRAAVHYFAGIVDNKAQFVSTSTEAAKMPKTEAETVLLEIKKARTDMRKLKIEQY